MSLYSKFYCCSTVLSEDKHLQSVNRAVLEARAEWKKIGRALGMSEGIIKSIRDPDDGECLHEVLTKWIHTGKATIYDLLEALDDPTVARADIAKRIRALKGEERIKVGLDPDTEMDIGNPPASKRHCPSPSVQSEPDK